ncbi:MarR family winged helix-turn-helix transcriptional regulator [Parasphingorhabdus pacifica]
MSESRWLDQREMAAWTAFLEASHLVSRRVEQQLREQGGLSHPQYEILVRLSEAPDGELRMTELADDVVTSKSGLSYQVAQLEKNGLVRRSRCPTDDRGINAALTEQGREKLAAIAPDHVALVRSSLIDLLSGEQLTALTDGMSTVVRAFRASDNQ